MVWWCLVSDWNTDTVNPSQLKLIQAAASHRQARFSDRVAQMVRTVGQELIVGFSSRNHSASSVFL